jgi:2-amino-4-hydroxy-6-hydroxymethyldihydropteridine diphosphokinase
MTNGRHSREAEISIYLGLGSNVGDRHANLREGVARIEKLIEVARESSIYETEPVGFSDQPWFLNQVIEAKVLASECGPLFSEPEIVAAIRAEAVLSELLNIERAMGRERTVPNGPRVIDIDLLLFGDLIIAHSKEDEEWPYIDQTDIFVPHPRMHERRFVLGPLCEIAPDLVHPTLRKTFKELLASLEDESEVRPYRKSAK